VSTFATSTDQSAPVSETSGRRSWWIPGAAVALGVAFLFGAMIGPAGPAWHQVPGEILDRLPFVSFDSGATALQSTVLWQIRMPRVVLAAIVGAMLALAGASYQGVFRNPLVDPYLLGVAAGAGLGATIVIVVNRSATDSWPVDPLPVVSFVGGLLAVLVTYTVGSAFGASRGPATLVLAGVAVTALATAMQTFLLQRNTEVVRQVYSWILGRLSTATWADVRLVLPYVVVSSVVLLWHRRLLDVLRVGDDEAAALGARVDRIRLTVVIAATLGTSAVVSVSGLIGFVGIMVPHLVRMLAGASYRRLLPLSVLVGAAFLIVADIPGRILSDPAETPIGVVTAFLGAPFFIVVLRTRQGALR
jgi:iron complex transport system permease protein